MHRVAEIAKCCISRRVAELESESEYWNLGVPLTGWISGVVVAVVAAAAVVVAVVAAAFTNKKNYLCLGLY